MCACEQRLTHRPGASSWLVDQRRLVDPLGLWLVELVETTLPPRNHSRSRP